MIKNKRLRSFISLHLVLVLACAAFLCVTYVLNRAFPGRYCTFLKLFHLYCPGCGGTRAAILLLRLRFSASFLYFPPCIIFAAMLLCHDIYFVWCLFTHRKLPGFPVWMLYATLAVTALWFVLRNILFYTCNIDPMGDLSSLVSLSLTLPA